MQKGTRINGYLLKFGLLLGEGINSSSLEDEEPRGATAKSRKSGEGFNVW